MTGDAVNQARNGSGARSAARTLNLLAAPLVSQILQALRDGSKQQAQLRRELGQPPPTTLRAQLKKLVEAGAVEKRRRNRFPGTLEYALSEAGRDLLTAVDALEAWLRESPTGPLELGGGPAKAAVKALADSWETAILRTLADGPLTLTQLDDAIAGLNYPSVERRLAAMRVTCLVEAREGNGRGTPYALTEWARESIGPIAAASCWKRRDRQASVR